MLQRNRQQYTLWTIKDNKTFKDQSWNVDGVVVNMILNNANFVTLNVSIVKRKDISQGNVEAPLSQLGKSNEPTTPTQELAATI